MTDRRGGRPPPAVRRRRSGSRRVGRVGWALAVLLGALTAATGVPARAAAYPSAAVSVEGHGWGPGAGMGQWGALGYALGGTAYPAILGHYYGGTSLAALGPGQAATPLRVAITENNGDSAIVTSLSAFSVSWGSGSVAVPGGQAVFMNPDRGAFDLYLGPGCAGPWAEVAAGVAGPTALPASDPALGDPAAPTEALQLCQIGGNLVARGDFEITYNSDGAARTVNVVPLEQYVADVVPNESPAGWGTIGGAGPQGQVWGFQELEAQAVAARSYAMAGLGSYGGYADTCDLACQTYRGIGNESARTDLAAEDTAAQVMEVAGGIVAATQYSSSTGGYSAPGTFPAVPDAGDAVCVPGACNPNHSWTASVPVSAIEQDWPQLGTFESITVTGRNGLGDLGGRVTSLTLVGSSQSVVLSGQAFADAVGLKSDWFAVTASLTGAAVGMSATGDGGGYWVAATDGGIFTFGDAGFYGSAGALQLNQPVVGMASTADGRGYWLVAADGGIFAFGDAGYFGSTGALRLNRPIVGMTATRDGGGYWLVAADGGIFSYGDAAFYGSTGAIALNRPVVGMAATPDGGGYWLVAADGGIFAFGDAAFYGSTGAIALNRPVVGMAATRDDRGYWLVAADGGIFAFGDAGFFGSAVG